MGPGPACYRLRVRIPLRTRHRAASASAAVQDTLSPALNTVRFVYVIPSGKLIAMGAGEECWCGNSYGFPVQTAPDSGQSTDVVFVRLFCLSSLRADCYWACNGDSTQVIPLSTLEIFSAYRSPRHAEAATVFRCTSALHLQPRLLQRLLTLRQAPRRRAPRPESAALRGRGTTHRTHPSSNRQRYPSFMCVRTASSVCSWRLTTKTELGLSEDSVKHTLPVLGDAVGRGRDPTTRGERQHVRREGRARVQRAGQHPAGDHSPPLPLATRSRN
jgi:hypothetical protein